VPNSPRGGEPLLPLGDMGRGDPKGIGEPGENIWGATKGPL